MTSAINQRVGVQQRVLPSYRVPFFDALAAECRGGLSIFAGKPRTDEALDTGAVPMAAQYFAGHNLHLLDGAFYLCWQKGLTSWLRQWQPDVLIMEANPRYLSSGSAIRWMKAQKRKVIGWGLGSPAPHGWFSKKRIYLRKHFVNQFDALVTYSQQGAQEYAELGYPESRIFVAPNAVAAKPKHGLPERSATYRNNRPVVAFVGRLQARKKVDLLLQACSRLPEPLKPELIIVGEGPEHRRLKDFAENQYPLARFTGAKQGAELERILRGADLFVLPGTGGLAVQQAMSFGLPVIVGQSDGTQSDLVRPENGWVLEKPDADVLSNLMQQALKDVNRLRQMGRASYRIVNNEINLENMVSVFATAISKALED